MPIRFEIFGEHAVLISWPNNISKKISLDIYSFNQKIQHTLPEAIIETVTTYCSLTVYIKVDIDKFSLISKLREIYQSNKIKSNIKPNNWKIPVCYDASFGLDLVKLAKQKNLSTKEVIKRHCKPLYMVDFLGFLPGFPYLSGLDPLLHTPRLAAPRPSVAKGSVAIGGKQTGIYPIESPGGWHIIGRTPLSFFDVQRGQPCFIKAQDTLQFYQITLDEFDENNDD